MDALIVIFITGLISLFVGMLKKPYLTLGIIVSGLVLSFCLQMNYGNYTSIFSKYDNLYFNITQLYFSEMAIGFTLLLVLAGFQYFKQDIEHTSDYLSLLLFSLCGAICLIGFTDLFMFFLGLEILSIPIYVMVGIKKQDVLSAEASLKYFFTGSFATAILLFGIALLYGATASFNIATIQEAIQSGSYSEPMLLIALLFIMASFLFKVGAVPFHFWGPDVYQGAPDIVMAFMATVVKIAAVFAFLKLYAGTFQFLSEFWTGVLNIAIILSLFLGYLSALRQTSFKRMLAYSSISNTGFALFALLTTSPSSAGSLWVFLVAYGCATIALVTISMIIHNVEDKIAAFKGIGYKNPFIGFVMIMSLLSLSGIPPLSGFFGKFLLLSNAINDHLYLVILALVSSAIGAFLYLRMIVLSLAKETENTVEKYPISILQYIVLGVCTVGLLGGWLIIIL